MPSTQSKLKPPRPATIPGASEHVLAVPGLGNLLISVASTDQTVHAGGSQPSLLAPPEPEAKKRPAIYVLDGNQGFAPAHATASMLRLGSHIPTALVVGIGYDDIDMATERVGLRTRDLTPTHDVSAAKRAAERAEGVPLPEGGNAEAFLDAILNIVKPFVETTYGADADDATLCGFSLGGLFALYTLFKRPASFNRYVVGSPSIWWDNRVILRYEAEYAAANTDLSAKVFLSIGSLEQEGEEMQPFAMVSNVHELDATLRARNYPSLQLTTHVFEGETHSSATPATYSRGLRAVFSR